MPRGNLRARLEENGDRDGHRRSFIEITLLASLNIKEGWPFPFYHRQGAGNCKVPPTCPPWSIKYELCGGTFGRTVTQHHRRDFCHLRKKPNTAKPLFFWSYPNVPAWVGKDNGSAATLISMKL